jgi:hypothetical protein
VVLIIVKITDYGNDGDKKFVEYSVCELSQKQLDFLDDNIADDTQVDGDVLKIRMFFDDELYPFQSEVAKFRMDDFIAREEIEMSVFLSSFLEDM